MDTFCHILNSSQHPAEHFFFVRYWCQSFAGISLLRTMVLYDLYFLLSALTCYAFLSIRLSYSLSPWIFFRISSLILIIQLYLWCSWNQSFRIVFFYHLCPSRVMIITVHCSVVDWTSWRSMAKPAGVSICFLAAPCGSFYSFTTIKAIFVRCRSGSRCFSAQIECVKVFIARILVS